MFYRKSLGSMQQLHFKSISCNEIESTQWNKIEKHELLIIGKAANEVSVIQYKISEKSPKVFHVVDNTQV